MASDTKAAPATIDAYIAASAPEARPLVERIRQTVRAAAPEAKEVISYRIPAFHQHGIIVYFAAFKNHIGLYPPITGDPKLVEAAAPYAGEKGNLRFPLDEPIPYALIERIVSHRVKQNLAKASATSKKRRGTSSRKRPAQRSG
jgi:uncharacterized protein YdhG (YjbR/CyaY superfamily)